MLTYYIFYQLSYSTHSFTVRFYQLVLKVDAYTKYSTTSHKSLGYIDKHSTCNSVNQSKAKKSYYYTTSYKNHSSNILGSVLKSEFFPTLFH